MLDLEAADSITDIELVALSQVLHVSILDLIDDTIPVSSQEIR